MESELEDEVLLRIEEESQRRTRAVRGMLREAGRLDLAQELDAKLRDVRLGVDAARSTWQAISTAQRRVLETMEVGQWLRRSPASKTRYDAIGKPGAISHLCSIGTARALCARELIACDGTVLDPEARFVLTERGRFVLRHGRPAPSPEAP